MTCHPETLLPALPMLVLGAAAIVVGVVGFTFAAIQNAHNEANVNANEDEEGT